MVSLWMTGSKGVRQKLGIQGGWKDLKFRGASTLPLIKKWPRWLLPHLHGLSFLSISPYHDQCLLPMLRPTLNDISELPQSLTDLHLNFIEDFRDEFIPFLPSGLIRLSLPRNRSLSPKALLSMPSELQILNLAQNLQISNLSALPRRLSSYIGNCSAVRPSQLLYSELPPTLTELRLEKSTFGESEWKLSHLALFALHQCLMSLSILDMKMGEQKEPVLTFPVNMTSLEMAGKVSIPKSLISSLPRDLITLKIVFTPNTEIDWDDETIFALPRGLTHLEIWNPPSPAHYAAPRITTYLTPDCFAYLPSRLRTLRLLPLTWQERINDRLSGPLPIKQVLQEHIDENMVHIPISVTDLFVRLQMRRVAIDYIFPSFSRLPPNLINFPSGGRFFLPLSGRKKTPISLLVGDIKPIRTLSWTGHPLLLKPSPISISSINAAPSVPSHELPGHEWLGYPENLTSLSLVQPPMEPVGDAVFYLSSSGPHDSWWTVGNMMPGLRHSLRFLEISNFDPYVSLNMLPHHLTVLHIRSVSILTDAAILKLPDTLTVLQISVESTETKNLLSDECIPALPHDLVEFQLASASFIRFDQYPLPRKIQTLRLPQFMRKYKNIDYKPMFPFWTTDLRMDDSNIDHHTFSNGLPPYLTRLEIDRATWMEGSFLVPLLPPTLLHLQINWLNLLDNDVPNLPAGLRVIIARDGSEMLSDDSASLWPPLLQKLIIPGTLFTNDGIKELPRTLKRIEMRKASYVDPFIIARLLPSITSWIIGTHRNR